MLEHIIDLIFHGLEYFHWKEIVRIWNKYLQNAIFTPFPDIMDFFEISKKIHKVPFTHAHLQFIEPKKLCYFERYV